MDQLSFPDMRHPLVAAFKTYHRENPSVYRALKKLAVDLCEKGHRRWGMKGLFEVLRWQRAMYTTGDEFKLNNNYTAFYARVLMHNEPELKDFFELRSSCSDGIANDIEKEDGGAVIGT